MKKFAAFLGCAVVAFAIGCGDAPPPPVAPAPAMTPEMMKGMSGGGTPGAAADAGEKKDDAAAEKKDDAAAEKKEDAPAEKKEEAPAEKKEEAGEKKE